MRLRTRTFLLCFAPVALLLGVSFWMLQWMVQAKVRDSLRASLRENERGIARLIEKNAPQNNSFLKVVAANPELKAGMELFLSQRNSAAARRTVEDQLRELGQPLGFDLISVSDPDGKPVAAVVRTENELTPAGASAVSSLERAMQVVSIPMDMGDENLGAIAIGVRFDVNALLSPAVLLENGTVLQSTVKGVPPAEIARALRLCRGVDECESRFGGAAWLSLPVPNLRLGPDHTLRILQNVDAAAAPLMLVLKRVFLFTGIGVALLALAGSVMSSRSIVKPIASVVNDLRSAERTGVLPLFAPGQTGIREIRELTESFNLAASAVRVAQENLHKAYVEFVGSLAHALDARDPYTAGHSKRVSDLSRATALAMGLGQEDLDRIQVGALLHDIGKIGVPDALLRKAGPLTEAEFAVIKEHPEIGRRILEGVEGFAPYLPSVQLHHENWDGTGYPLGQAGLETPV
ncbi:MAG: HD domain-containing protein, partial [Acidobacteriota bacterium]|nr:HD domain-containing protein [Acidobacteriota bacterium]